MIGNASSKNKNTFNHIQTSIKFGDYQKSNKGTLILWLGLILVGHNSYSMSWAQINLAQSVGAAEYTNCIYTER